MSKIPGHKYLTTNRPCRPTKKEKLPEPQLPEEDRPSCWKRCGITYEKLLQADTYKCLYCPFTTSSSAKFSSKGKKYKSPQSSMHDHCVKHFPPTFHCLDCGDSFHLKTEYNRHFRSICEYCGSSVQQNGLKAHYTKEKCKKAQNELLKKTMNAWKTKIRRRCIRIEPEMKPKLKLKPREKARRTESE